MCHVFRNESRYYIRLCHRRLTSSDFFENNILFIDITYDLLDVNILKSLNKIYSDDVFDMILNRNHKKLADNIQKRNEIIELLKIAKIRLI